MLAVADPPGSTPAFGVSTDAAIVNCPYARDTDAADSVNSNGKRK